MASLAMVSGEGSEKCPCCDNPWARATGDLFAKMCEGCNSSAGGKIAIATFGLSKDNMDLTIQPHENFYYHANGGWIRNNPIPGGYPNWNTFLALQLQSQEQCKRLLDELDQELDSDGHAPEVFKVRMFYRAAMNEDAIEQAGTKPLEPLLGLIEDIVEAASRKDKSQYAALLGKMDACYGIWPFFAVGVSPDAKNSDHSIAQLMQGGLGLPDRDYYFDEDKQDKRDAYRKHIAMMLTLLLLSSSSTSPQEHSNEIIPTPTTETKLAAEMVMALETRLAAAHMTRTENRDPYATYNKMSIADLVKKVDGVFDFAAYWGASTGKSVTDIGEINVRNVHALECAAQEAATIAPECLRQYLTWRAVSSCAPYLSTAFVMEDFGFFEKTLSGTAEIKPRWKRAMAFTEKALGEAMGKLYCARYFDEDCKVLANRIVEQVRKALQDRLLEVDWIKSDSTREEALKKMSRFRVKIGYPNKWIDYRPMELNEGEFFLSMVFKSRAFQHQRASAEMNAPTDREKWFMSPQTVNAYYHPSLNEIVFPAAILQHPFFDKNADDAVNFGAMGAVVGHEMTHGFDDKGRKYNFEGILEDWWTAEDAAEYEKRVNVMVEQANDFTVHGKAVQGKLTSGENIADLGGLRLSLRALRAQPNFQEDVTIDGFTSRQRFFLSWAQCWRQNITKDRALQLLTLDPHGPNEMRCNGPLSNIPEFHEAFNIPADSPMYKPMDGRVDIW